MSGRIAAYPASPRRVVVCAGLLLAATSSLAWPGAAPAARIDSELAYTRDGCQRTRIRLLNPRDAQSWVYVDRSRDPVELTGDIEQVRISDEDLYAQHETRGIFLTPDYYVHHDVNILVRPPDDELLATGNEDDLLKAEAHTGEWLFRDREDWRGPFGRAGGDYYPQAAWGMPGDQTVMRGPLVWDCAHFPPLESGERTELHTPRWVQIDNALPVGYEFAPDRPTIASEHTVYGNSNRQASGLIQEYRKTCDEGSCSETALQDPLVRDGVETFFLAAPKRPSESAELRWREVRFPVRRMNNVGRSAIEPAEDESGVWVAIDMRGQSGPERDNGYAARIYVGWSESPAGVGFKKVRTEFLRYWCWNDFDPGLAGSGEFQLQFAAGNDWWFKWDAGLEACDDSRPEVVLNPRPIIDTIVPDDQQLPVRLRGYENDDPLPGQQITDYDDVWPLADDTLMLEDPSGNYSLEARTTVLRSYPPAP